MSKHNQQSNCPFMRTKKNNERRLNPPSHRVAACYVLHDHIMLLHEIATTTNDDEAWNEVINQTKGALSMAKSPWKTKPSEPVL